MTNKKTTTQMTKRINALFFLLSLLTVMLVASGCSKDDAKTPVEQPAGGIDNEPIDPLTETTAELNQELAGLNFQDLEPLYKASHSKAQSKAPTRGTADELFADFNSKLANLLELLRGNFNVALPYGVRFTYKSFNDVLETTWDVAGSIEAGVDGSTYYFQRNSNGRGQVVYKADDGSNYTIEAVMDKDTYIADWNINVTRARLLIITKDGEQVLKITAGSRRERPLWALILPFIVRENTFTGEVIYKDFDITLDCERESTHCRNVDITYAKVGDTEPILVMNTVLTDDANIWKLIRHDIEFKADFIVKALNGILTFNGTVENVNCLVLDGITLNQLMEQGTESKEECDKLVENLNNNLNLKMYLMDVDLGRLFLGTVYDETTKVYKPTILINSQLFGPKDYVLTEILKSLGVNMDGILQAAAYLD